MARLSATWRSCLRHPPTVEMDAAMIRRRCGPAMRYRRYPRPRQLGAARWASPRCDLFIVAGQHAVPGAQPPQLWVKGDAAKSAPDPTAAPQWSEAAPCLSGRPRRHRRLRQRVFFQPGLGLGPNGSTGYFFTVVTCRPSATATWCRHRPGQGRHDRCSSFVRARHLRAADSSTSAVSAGAAPGPRPAEKLARGPPGRRQRAEKTP